MPNVQGWEILIIIALVLLLFGAKRLPDAARGLGRSMRIFKAETKGLAGEAANAAASDASAAPQTAAPAAPVAPAQPSAAGTAPAEQAPAAQPERAENA